MHFLDARGFHGGHGDQQIRNFAQFPAGLARERRREDRALFRSFDSGDHVRAVSGCRESDRHIARAAKGFDLTRENVLESEVVPAGGDLRSVRAQRQSRQRPPFPYETYG